MEAKDADKRNHTGKDHWILCKSRNRAGRKYYFNTATGESKWCTKDDAEKVNNVEPSVTRKIRHPAQDRLKRLQKDLRVKKSTVEKPVRKTSKTLVNPSDTLKVSTTETKILKKSGDSVEEDEFRCKKKRKITNTESQPIASVPDTTNEPAEKKVKQDKNVLHNIKHKIVKNSVIDAKKLNDLKKYLMPTFPVLQKYTIPKATKSIENNAQPVVGKSITTQNPNLVKPVDITKIDNSKNFIAFNEIDHALNSQVLKEETTSDVIKETVTPPNGRKGIANQRLEQLREKLQAQLKDTNSIIEKKVAVNISNNNNEEEPMDWESIDLVKSIREDLKKGYYSKKVINDSLQYFAEEQRGKSKQKWRKDFYYIIPDTNVWLNHLTFLDEISKMKLLETEGSMLYIPYIVIKELDGLKNRETLELRAKMAINYIHEQLKLNNIHVQTQSASEEREHLIIVDCPDDSIINCCLQVKRHVDHLMLLSEDTNLRNKAKCNDVFSTTKSDLLSCH